MRTVRLILAYDGSAYAGWQMQANTLTVQQVLEDALRQVTGGEVIRPVASSRTDAGVHALGQLVSFTTQSKLPADVFCRALNAVLPDDISIIEAADAPFGFHAIRDTIGKRYRYVVQHGKPRDLFARAYAWHVPQTLAIDAMQEAARGLVGTHDFCAFENQGSERESTVRTVHELVCLPRRINGADHLHIEISGNGFLYNMVRNITGTLVSVGRGKHPPEWPAQVLASGDRRLGGMTAPPQGLVLLHVDYREQ